MTTFRCDDAESRPRSQEGHSNVAQNHNCGCRFDARRLRQYAIAKRGRIATADSWDLRGPVETMEVAYEVGNTIANSNAWPSWYKGNEFRAIRMKSLRAK